MVNLIKHFKVVVLATALAAGGTVASAQDVRVICTSTSPAAHIMVKFRPHSAGRAVVRASGWEYVFFIISKNNP